jgi:hypothetical protein
MNNSNVSKPMPMTRNCFQCGRPTDINKIKIPSGICKECSAMNYLNRPFLFPPNEWVMKRRKLLIISLTDEEIEAKKKYQLFLEELHKPKL